jgi:hypothetical protein
LFAPGIQQGTSGKLLHCEISSQERRRVIAQHGVSRTEHVIIKLRDLEPRKEESNRTNFHSLEPRKEESEHKVSPTRNTDNCETSSQERRRVIAQISLARAKNGGERAHGVSNKEHVTTTARPRAKKGGE